jgi:hypothetical protein
VVFDEVFSHNLLGSFPLLSIDVLQIDSMYLSASHFDDDFRSMSVSSSTISIVTCEMDIDGEALTDSHEVSSFIMIGTS